MEKITPHHMALAGLWHDIGTFMSYASRRPTHADDLKKVIQEVVPSTFQKIILDHFDSPRIVLADKLAVADSPRASKSPNQVVSVFSTLGQGEKQTRHIPIRPLSLSKEILFPKLNQSESPQAYTELWNLFYQEIKVIGEALVDDLDGYIEATQSVMERYTWCIPSGYNGADDISLYDHSRVVSALASCITQIEDAHLPNVGEHIPVATFIEGDISGIQRFLYSVPMKGATKQLRSRSFYLQLLTEVIARYILHIYQLPLTNLIYVGGGHFYILAPPDVNTNTLRQKIDDILLRHHDGDVHLGLGQITLHADEFLAGKFSQKWSELKRNTDTTKTQRYAYFSADQMANLFANRPHGQDELSQRRDERDNQANNAKPSSFGESLEEFARGLSRAEAILIIYINPLNHSPSRFEAVLAEFGFVVELINHHASSIKTSAKAQRVIVQGIRGVPSSQMMKLVRAHFTCMVVPSLRYTVNITPMVNGDERPANFEELSQASAGIKQLGVLRMDVDDLGKLFSQGFKHPSGESRASLARVATLSKALSLYFEGWVGEICTQMNRRYIEKIDDTENNGRKIHVEGIYAVYSGGDDLFIVGRWDILPQIAQWIHDDFAEYTCHNSHVHISAGITLHKGKYPLYLAAEDAAEALDMAKGIDTGKNAITFLGESIRWSEWDNVITLRDELQNLLDIRVGGKRQVDKSLLQLVLHFYDQYEDTRKANRMTKLGNQQIVWGAWMWRSAYQFTRLAERIRDNYIKIRIRAIQNELLNKPQLIATAARWTEAINRDD